MSGGIESMAEDENLAASGGAPSGWLPFPREQFEMYVRAMPQGEAQTALIYLVHFLSELAASQSRGAR